MNNGELIKVAFEILKDLTDQKELKETNPTDVVQGYILIDNPLFTVIADKEDNVSVTEDGVMITIGLYAKMNDELFLLDETIMIVGSITKVPDYNYISDDINQFKKRMVQ